MYVVDFYDRRAAHLDPVDNWDKTNGRIYRIEYKGGPKDEPFDLREEDSAELAELLKHPNEWWRNEARRMLAERQDKSVHPKLRKWLLTEKGQTRARIALDALRDRTGGWSATSTASGRTPNEYVRAWAVRFLVDDGIIPDADRGSASSHGREREQPGGAGAARLFGAAARPRRTRSTLTSPLMDNPLTGGRSATAAVDLVGARVREHGATRPTRCGSRTRTARSSRDFFTERVARRFLSGRHPARRAALFRRCST